MLAWRITVVRPLLFDGNDVIDGGSGVDIIIAEGGNDIVFGGSENDFLWGDYEDETASGGNDLLVGGAGDYFAIKTQQASNDTSWQLSA